LYTIVADGFGYFIELLSYILVSLILIVAILYVILLTKEKINEMKDRVKNMYLKITKKVKKNE
jgi:hypothetical protein